MKKALNKIWAILALIFLKLIKGEDEMTVIYALLIMKGLKTFTQVPAKLKEEVRLYLRAMELDENGYPLEG